MRPRECLTSPCFRADVVESTLAYLAFFGSFAFLVSPFVCTSIDRGCIDSTPTYIAQTASLTVS